MEGLERPQRIPFPHSSHGAACRKGALPSPRAPAWPGMGLPSLWGSRFGHPHSHRQHGQTVRQLWLYLPWEHHSPAPEPLQARGQQGWHSVLLHPGCCAAGARSAVSWEHPSAPSLSEHTVPWSTILPGADLRPRAAGGTIALGCCHQQSIGHQNQHRIGQTAGTGANSSKSHRNPQPTGALGQARCWESRISTHKTQPRAWPRS